MPPTTASASASRRVSSDQAQNATLAACSSESSSPGARTAQATTSVRAPQMQAAVPTTSPSSRTTSTQQLAPLDHILHPWESRTQLTAAWGALLHTHFLGRPPVAGAPVTSAPSIFLQHPVVARFCSRHAPPISVPDYAKRLVQYMQCSPSAFPIALTYFLRATQAIYRIYDRGTAAGYHATRSDSHIAPLPIASGPIHDAVRVLSRFPRRKYGSAVPVAGGGDASHLGPHAGLARSASSFNLSFGGGSSQAIAVSLDVALAEQERQARSLLTAFQVHPLCIHRLMLASCVLAIKYIDDIFLPTTFYANVGGVSPLELANLEWGLFELLDHDAFVEDGCLRAAVSLFDLGASTMAASP